MNNYRTASFFPQGSVRTLKIGITIAIGFLGYAGLSPTLNKPKYSATFFSPNGHQAIKSAAFDDDSDGQIDRFVLTTATYGRIVGTQEENIPKSDSRFNSLLEKILK